MRIGLVACSKQKLDYPAPARELYTSPLFQKAATHCEENYDRWFILSAKYGLLEPWRVIEPYDETLNDKPSPKRKEWARMVLDQITINILADKTFYFHAGVRYRENLEPHLDSVSPLKGLGIGQQLAWYANQKKVSDPKFFCVVGNRDHLKIYNELGGFEKLPIWHFIEGNHRDFLTSLVYLRGMQVPPGRRFIDCGAWSYKTEEFPRWSPEECAEKYGEIVKPGDFVASPDHMVLRDHDAEEEARRIAITLQNAMKFRPLIAPDVNAVGVTHGNSIETRIRMTEELLEMGYENIAVGSVAMRAGSRKWLRALMEEMAKLKGKHGFYMHVLGVSALSWYHEFKEFGVDSYDGSAMFFSAFTGATYYWPNEEGQIAKYSVKELQPWAIPECDCPPCIAMRNQGIDTRTLGSNESNMGRAVHNINMYLRALKAIAGQPQATQGKLDFGAV